MEEQGVVLVSLEDRLPFRLSGPLHSGPLFLTKETDGRFLTAELEHSSCIRAAAFDVTTDNLFIMLRNSEGAYVYGDMIIPDFIDLISAKSPGAYYNKNIWGRKPSGYFDAKDLVPQLRLRHPVISSADPDGRRTRRP